MRKVFDFGLPRKLIELVLEFIPGMRVKLCLGKVQTGLLDRNDVGGPKGSFEGTLGFNADSIDNRISKYVKEIGPGSK